MDNQNILEFRSEQNSHVGGNGEKIVGKKSLRMNCRFKAVFEGCFTNDPFLNSISSATMAKL